MALSGLHPFMYNYFRPNISVEFSVDMSTAETLLRDWLSSSPKRKTDSTHHTTHLRDH